GAMAVRDIAARNAVRAADALEPGPDVIGNILVLAVIEGRCGLRQARQGSNQRSTHDDAHACQSSHVLAAVPVTGNVRIRRALRLRRFLVAPLQTLLTLRC